MPQTFNIQLERPIQGATLLASQSASGAMASASQADHMQMLQEIHSRKDELTAMSLKLKSIVDTLARLQSEQFARHKEDIANLAVEIARKILAYKVEHGDYEIQEIIKQALDDAPVAEDIVIRLNPQDYAQLEHLMKSPEINIAKGATFVSDVKIEPAQCVLETPKGIIESFIDQHLDKISEALKKAG
jgi:flagellar biosynthesis/type III secretory pathway protein FliH